MYQLPIPPRIGRVPLVLVGSSPPRGFTLVEFLAALAVLGVLMTLLIPAVQFAREASRRTQCQKNLRQIGLALALHVEMSGSFPTGCIGCRLKISADGSRPIPQRYISWNTQLLPFLEHGSLWQAYDFSAPSYANVNRSVGSTILPLLLCPSVDDATLRNPQGLWRECAFSDYGGIYGVEGGSRDAPTPNAPHWLRDDSLGVLLYEMPVPPQSITDGLSHTAIVAETVQRRHSESEWVNGANVFAQEEATPINAASGLGNELGSAHPGGAIILFCDGHVRFVRDAIAQPTLNALLTKAGTEVELD